MDDKYNLACTEILEVLKYLPQGDLKKIPQKEIDFFENNKAKNYVFKFNENLSFEEQSLLPETQAIIVKLYKDYFYSSKIEKENIETNNINIEYKFKHIANTKNELAVHNDKKKWYEVILNLFKRNNYKS